MSSTTSLLVAALAFFGSVNASPVELHKRKAFSLHQVERKKFLRNGPRQMAKDLAKYNIQVPESVIVAAAAVNGSAPAVPVDEYDSLYLTPVTVGNSTVQLDLDTGSADLWVFSSLQASAQLTGHDYYKVDPAKKLEGASWRITYGDGSGAAGAVYADKAVVGGVTATSQAIGAATSVSTAFQRDVDTDGLLGLSFSTLNTIRPTPQKTWIDNVKDSLTQPLFAVALKYHAAGTYDFGFIDKSKYTGDITWVDVNDADGFWEFTGTGYTVGTGTEVNTTIVAIGDTGTTLLYLPPAIVAAYYGKVSGAQNPRDIGGWVFPCNSTLPDFSITIGGKKQVLPGKHINYAPLQVGSATCYGGIQRNDGLPFSIFGDIFLKSKYVVHEMGARPRLGFAQQVGV